MAQPPNLQQELYACLDEVKRRRPWMSHKTPEPWAALVMSDNTRNFYGRDPGRVEERYMAAVFGAFRAAVEEHRVVTVINDWNLNPKDLAPFKVLILANTACLDDAQAAAVARFVEQGGGLVASLDASLFDEFGDPRPNFALARVFGVEHRGTVAATAPGRPAPIDENFARSIGPDYWEKRKDVFDFKQDTDSFLNRGRMATYVGANSVTFKGPAVRVVPASPAAKVVGTLRVKSGDDPSRAEVPGVVAHTYGRGRVVYFAGGFDTAYYLYAYPYQRLLLAHAIDWAASAPQPVTVEAPMCVHSAVMRQAPGGSERLVVHLYSDLNTTAFHALPNDDVPLREEVVPIRDIRVTFAPEYRLGRVHLEPGGLDLKVESTPRGSGVAVPRLDIHAMVVAELRPAPARASAAARTRPAPRAVVAPVHDRPADRSKAQQHQAGGLGHHPVGEIRERDLTGLGGGESQVDVVLGADGHRPLVQEDIAGLDVGIGEVLGVVEADGVGPGAGRPGDLPEQARPGHTSVVEDPPGARARVDQISPRTVDVEGERDRRHAGEIEADVGGGARHGVDHGRARATRTGRGRDRGDVLGTGRGRQADQHDQGRQAPVETLLHRYLLPDCLSLESRTEWAAHADRGRTPRPCDRTAPHRAGPLGLPARPANRLALARDHRYRARIIMNSLSLTQDCRFFSSFSIQ